MGDCAGNGNDLSMLRGAGHATAPADGRRDSRRSPTEQHFKAVALAVHRRRSGLFLSAGAHGLCRKKMNRPSELFGKSSNHDSHQRSVARIVVSHPLHPRRGMESTVDVLGGGGLVPQVQSALQSLLSLTESSLPSLAVAAHKGDALSLRRLVGVRADVNCRHSGHDGDGDCKTGLMLALSSGQQECARILLDARADVNLASRSGHTALSLALRNPVWDHDADWETMRDLYVRSDHRSSAGDPEGERKQRARRMFEEGVTPVYWLLELGSNPLVHERFRRALAGAKVKMQGNIHYGGVEDDPNIDPLAWALDCNWVGVAAALLCSGAQLSSTMSPDGPRRSPIVSGEGLSRADGPLDFAKIEALARVAVSFDAGPGPGTSAMFLTSALCLVLWPSEEVPAAAANAWATSPGRRELALLLVRLGADVDSTQLPGWWTGGLPPVGRTLLPRLRTTPADVKASSPAESSGSQAFAFAVANGLTEIASLYLDCGVFPWVDGLSLIGTRGVLEVCLRLRKRLADRLGSCMAAPLAESVLDFLVPVTLGPESSRREGDHAGPQPQERADVIAADWGDPTPGQYGQYIPQRYPLRGARIF